MTYVYKWLRGIARILCIILPAVFISVRQCVAVFHSRFQTTLGAPVGVARSSALMKSLLPLSATYSGDEVANSRIHSVIVAILTSQPPD